METQVKTLIKIGGLFHDLADYDGEVPDEDYVNGAIVWLNNNNEEILGQNHWDLVDQLWSYILEGIESLENGNDYECHFPDQPLLLRFRRINDTVVDVTIGDDITTVNHSYLVQSLTWGAERFFEKMKQLLPQHSSSWDIDVKKARALSKT